MFAALCAYKIHLPGLYYDEINPDYLVVPLLMKLAGGGPTPAHIAGIAGFDWQTITTYYIGMLPVYLTAPVHALLGYGVATMRISHALFGVAIVALCYLLVWRASASRKAALAAALLLAIDAGFVLSFRTQYYITLLAAPFLLGSLAIIAGEAGRMRAWPLFAAGLCYGLACWTHLTFAFFAPAWVAAAVLYRRGLRMPAVLAFVAGGLLGVAPWAWGIARAWSAYPTTSDFIASFGSVVYYQVPLLERASRVMWNFMAVLGNIQPMMVTGSAEALAVPYGKLGAMVVLGAAAAVGLVMRGAAPERRAALLVMAFVASFLVIALLAGDRVAPWHLAVNVPLLYVAMALAVPAWSRLLGARVLVPFASVALGAMLAISLLQQAALFRELERTGGHHHFSEVRSTIARAALSLRPDAALFFPDWGYSFQAIYLTRGDTPVYHLDGDTGRVMEVLCSGRAAIVVVDATTSSRARVEGAMVKLGVLMEPWRGFAERDGQLNTELAVIAPEANRVPCVGVVQ